MNSFCVHGIFAWSLVNPESSLDGLANRSLSNQNMRVAQNESAAVQTNRRKEAERHLKQQITPRQHKETNLLVIQTSIPVPYHFNRFYNYFSVEHGGPEGSSGVWGGETAFRAMTWGYRSVRTRRFN
jgi:hypothetical protein